MSEVSALTHDNNAQVIKHDLQLLAQISSSSEESYFKAFMMNLLELFSTDRRLLETRGSLIIRQLCLNLNTERIYRKFAEILEKEEVRSQGSALDLSFELVLNPVLQDLEFASVIVQKLNIILITSPELADFRKRLKSLETRVHPHYNNSLSRALADDVLPLFSKTAKLSSQPCTDRGATMLLRCSRFAFSLRHTSMLRTCCISCKSYKYLSHNALPADGMLVIARILK